MAVHRGRGRRHGRGRCTPGMLNERGGYEADVTVTRLAHDRYLLVTSSASALRDLSWIERHTPPDVHAAVVDVSSAYAVYGVMGPRSRELLQRLTRADLSERGRSRSPPARRSTWATPRCGRSGSPTSASSAGSSTCRASSPSVCTNA